MSDLSDIAPAAVLPPQQTGGRVLPVSSWDIETEGLGKSFGETRIFRDVSIQLARGEAVALVGANGAGKSTILRCLMGLIPASAGRVSVLGTDVTQATGAQMRAVRCRIGLVSQKHNLVPRLCALSNVVHGLLGRHPGLRHWSHALAPATSREAALAALDKVGLAHMALRRADRLSGGQSQRVAIARALIGAPRIIIADEPCASLDPSAGEDVMALFFELVREEGVTVVFTSHNLEHAVQYGDRVIGLADGGIKIDARARSLSVRELRGLYG